MSRLKYLDRDSIDYLIWEALAMPAYQALDTREIVRLEAAIDCWNEELGQLENRTLPGGPSLIWQAHAFRCLVRSAEYGCRQLNAMKPLTSVGMAYINRLYDLLFVTARLIAMRKGIAKTLWQAAAKPEARRRLQKP